MRNDNQSALSNFQCSEEVSSFLDAVFKISGTDHFHKDNYEFSDHIAVQGKDHKQISQEQTKNDGGGVLCRFTNV